MASAKDRQRDRRISAQAANQRRRRRRRGGRKTLHYLLLLLFVLAAGVVLSLTVFFKVESVVVIGVDKYSPDDIIASTGITAGEDNLLRLDKDAIAETLSAEYPYIDSVHISYRFFPVVVELQIAQAVPVGALSHGGEVALFTREGKILERGDLFVPTDLPLIKGMSLGAAQPGELLGEENQERLVMLGYLFEAAKKVGFGPITNVDVSDRLNMRIVYEARLVLLLGSEADMEYKLTFLQTVIDDLGPDAQARLDASNIAAKRVLVKFGVVQGGEFTPISENIYDQLISLPSESEAQQEDGGDSEEEEE